VCFFIPSRAQALDERYVEIMPFFDEYEIEKFKSAGKILRETKAEMKRFVHEGMPIIDVCEKAENLIREKGGKPAFPCNVSINEIAAHYTSPPNDDRTIPEEAIVKVDVGAHVDGYVADSEITICFNPEYASMVETAEQALKTATRSVHPGMFTSKLGGIIERAIKSRGFKPVSNLTGHQVGRYLVHAGTSLPNVSCISLSKIKLGRVYAIEPFVTLPNAAGKVENGEESTIFRFLKLKRLRNPYAKQLVTHIKNSFRTLPFTERWLQGVVPRRHHAEAFRELLSARCLMGYPVFIEVSRKPVAQAEHTILIVEDGCLVLT
jgi:methionyl aminopeptidase